CWLYCLSQLDVSLFFDMNYLFFSFKDAAPTDIYTLSLHDALPIYAASRARRRRARRLDRRRAPPGLVARRRPRAKRRRRLTAETDRKSTRLNSSHGSISYAVFCLKKKKKNTQQTSTTSYDSHRRRP